MPLPAGFNLGRYEILEVVGQGGMGEVYRGRDTELKREVAIKVLPESLSQDAERLRLFRQEALSTAQLNHPNILAVYDVGSSEGHAYIVAELLEGKTLRETLDDGLIPLNSTVRFAGEIAKGLAAAHKKGIVHRDLKPENIFVAKDEHIKILDFGLAKLTKPEAIRDGRTLPVTASPTTIPGVVMGTAAYMSPEQAEGRPVDHRSDIFSFGIILYEMLSGSNPYKRDSAIETMNAILKEEPPELSAKNTNIPAWFEHVARRCLEKDPEERFQSALDLTFSFENPPRASVAMSEKQSVQPRRSFVAAAIAASVILLGAVIAVLVIQIGQRLPPPSFRLQTFGNGVVESARFGPDGQTIVYSGKMQGRTERFFSKRLGNLESSPLSYAGTSLESISVGNSILFTDAANTLWQVQLGGTSSPRELKKDTEWADWMPDGKRFVWVHREQEKESLELTDIEGSTDRTLYEPQREITYVRVSPKGDLVAFLDHPLADDPRSSVNLVDLNGRTKKLSGEWKEASGLAWSPKGNEIWFTATGGPRGRSLYAVTTSGKQRLVSTMPTSLLLHDISSDGRVLLESAYERGLIEGSGLTDSKQRDLTWLDYSGAADLSDDGKQLLFSELGQGGGEMGQVYLRKTDGSAPKLLGEGLAQGLSPDGNWALVIIDGPPSKLVLIPTGPGSRQDLTKDFVERYESATWFRDGRRILETAKEKGVGKRYRCYVQDVLSGSVRPVSGADELGTLVTPDGKFLVVEPPNGKPRLHPLEAGLELPRIPGFDDLDKEDKLIGWSRDGRYLYKFRVRGLPAKIYSLDTRTGKLELVKEIRLPDAGGVTGLDTVSRFRLWSG